MDFACDALGFDDDQAVLVDDEVVDLGDFAFAFETEVVDHMDRIRLAERPVEIERHLLLGFVAVERLPV